MCIYVPIARTRSWILLIYQEDDENRLAVQEALSMMSSAFSDVEPAKVKLVEALIMQNIEKVGV